MTLHYMPTFISDLISYDARQYWPVKFPCMVSGAADFQFRYTYTADENEASADNQSRWNSEMQEFFNFQHLPIDTTLSIYPAPGPLGFGVYKSATTVATRHTLDELRKPYTLITGVDSGTPHTHPEAYNPGFTIPPTGSFPFQLYIGPPSPLERPETQSPGVTTWKEIYPWFGHLVDTGSTPHDGFYTYGHWGVSGTSDVQSYDLYWITKKLYFLHSRNLLNNQQHTDQQKQDYKDQTDPDPETNPWQLDANWISRPVYSTSYTGSPSSAPVTATRWFRLTVPSTKDTWEWRGEWYLDRITPGVRPGYEKVFERAAVYPLMNVEEWREEKVTMVTHLQREGELPVMRYRDDVESERTKKRFICEYGI